MTYTPDTPAGLPGAPPLPPTLTAIPGMTTIPGMPSLPGMPGLPGMPPMPGLPGMPSAAPPSQQATRHARRVYVGGLPPTANEQSVATFFSHALAAVGGNTAGPGRQGQGAAA